MSKAENEYETDTVVFETPPPRRDRRYDWASISAQLRVHPNEWAKVFDDDVASIVTAIRIGSIKSMRPEVGIEVRTTNNTRNPERRCTLWARYVPENDTEGSA
jgi:hypothetical protein